MLATSDQDSTWELQVLMALVSMLPRAKCIVSDLGPPVVEVCWDCV